MISKIFKQLKSEPTKVGEDELQKIYNDIDAKKQEIADKKAKFNEEYSDGSRLTKHRFTL